MKRRAYILVFVLGVTTVVTALGLSYVAANGTVMTQATNRYAAVRAQYVAESGAALASHFIRYLPTTVACGGAYAGGAGIAIDSSFDTVDITVTPSALPNQYVVQATSVVRNALGTESRAKQSIRTEAIVPPDPKVKVSQALLCNGSVTVQSGTSIEGNLHANGSVDCPLLGGGRCTGIVSATGLVLWLGNGSPSAFKPLQPSLPIPPAASSLYSSYKIKGSSYAAYSGYAKSDMSSSDVAGLGSALDSSANNPGRIVFLPAGDFRLRGRMNFTGTLVVRGNLEVDGDGIQLQSVTDYPALVVTGNILCKSSNVDMTVTGPVLCGGRITDDGRSGCQLTFKGAVVVGNGASGGSVVSRTGGSSKITFTWNCANNVFWDLAMSAAPDPITVLKWREN